MKGAMSIGKRLAAVRRLSGLNQIDFASHFGVSKNSIKDYERGATDPSYSLLVKLCTRYKIDANWLMLGRGNPDQITGVVYSGEGAKACGEAQSVSHFNRLVEVYFARPQGDRRFVHKNYLKHYVSREISNRLRSYGLPNSAHQTHGRRLRKAQAMRKLPPERR